MWGKDQQEIVDICSWRWRRRRRVSAPALQADRVVLPRRPRERKWQPSWQQVEEAIAIGVTVVAVVWRWFLDSEDIAVSRGSRSTALPENEDQDNGQPEKLSVLVPSAETHLSSGENYGYGFNEKKRERAEESGGEWTGKRMDGR